MCAQIISDFNGEKLLKSFNSGKDIEKIKVAQFFWHTVYNIHRHTVIATQLQQKWNCVQLHRKLQKYRPQFLWHY